MIAEISNKIDRLSDTIGDNKQLLKDMERATKTIRDLRAEVKTLKVERVQLRTKMDNQAIDLARVKRDYRSLKEHLS